MAAVMSKECKGCGFDLPTSCFRPKRSKCRECERSYDRARGQTEARSEYRHSYRHNHWEEHTNTTRSWGERNREKQRAHAAVARALKKGTLIRPGACEKCGCEECKIEAHHDDYSRQLDVKWLCEPCHKQRHVELRLEATKYQEVYKRWDINEALGVKDEVDEMQTGEAPF